ETFPKGQKTGANSETLPNTDIRTYTYDDGRRLASRLDQQGVTTSYGYDNANRLTGRIYPDGKNDAFTYDLAGRLLTATSDQYKNRVERTYDAAGRLQEEWLIGLKASFLPGAWKVGYAFDAANRLTHLTYPDGSVVA